jgi:hypothetical protein
VTLPPGRETLATRPPPIRRYSEDDRNDRYCLFCRDGWSLRSDNDIDIEVNELGRDLGTLDRKKLRVTEGEPPRLSPFSGVELRKAAARR